MWSPPILKAAPRSAARDPTSRRALRPRCLDHQPWRMAAGSQPPYRGGVRSAKVDLLSLSRQEAKIEVKYVGSQDQLKSGLAEVSLDLAGGDPAGGSSRQPRRVRGNLAALSRARAMTMSRLGLNLPNLISLGRLLLVPLAISLILDGSYWAAFWVFVVAGVSDALDGFIAKGSIGVRGSAPCWIRLPTRCCSSASTSPSVLPANCGPGSSSSSSFATS